ncbi:hypothetical protein BgiMline_008559, partial [Biomphalaria glabrata]
EPRPVEQPKLPLEKCKLPLTAVYIPFCTSIGQTPPGAVISFKEPTKKKMRLDWAHFEQIVN